MTKARFPDSQRTVSIASSPNRDYATGRLLLEIERDHQFSILLVRFDGLNRATYRRGDASTDAVWGRVLGVLTKDRSRRDLCCRLADEEFLLILPETTDVECRVLLERIRRRWMPLPGALEAKVEMRIGIASYPAQGSTVEDLFATVDAAVRADAVRERSQCLRSVDRVRRVPLPTFRNESLNPPHATSPVG